MTKAPSQAPTTAYTEVLAHLYSVSSKNTFFKNSRLKRLNGSPCSKRIIFGATHRTAINKLKNKVCLKSSRNKLAPNDTATR